MTGTSFFILHVANLTNPVNLANLIRPSIRAAVWANPSSLDNPICLSIRVAVLANPVNPARVMLLRLSNLVNPAVVTQIFSHVRDLCSNTYHPQVAWLDHLTTLEQYHTCSLWVLSILWLYSHFFALIFTNQLTNASSIDVNLGRHFAWS
jgi:hypothetical protein